MKISVLFKTMFSARPERGSGLIDTATTDGAARKHCLKGHITILLSAIALFLSPFIGACTHKPVHPTKSEREWAADHKACEQWVREGIREDPDVYDNLDEMKMIKRCMQQKGWTWERSDWFKLKKESTE